MRDRDLAAAGLWLCVLLALFLPVWCRGLSFFWGDLTYIHHPWKAFQAQSLAQGRVPLWNPYLYMGMPQAATMQDSFFYPGNALFMIFGFATAAALFQLFHYWLAGLLTALWLRSLGLPRRACWAGGLCYGLGGFLASRLPFLNHLALLSLVPAFLLFFRRPALLGLSLSLAFWAGYPPFLAGSMAAAWILFLALANFRKGKTILEAARAWTLGGAQALLLTACLLLPALELFANSRRSGGLGLEEALRFGYAPRDLWQWVSPWLSRSFDPARRWWQCSYIGFSGFSLAVLGLAGLKTRRAALLAVFLAFTALLLLGDSNVASAWLWAHFAPLRFVRYPGNMAYLALPALALLTAVGMGKRSPWILAAIAGELFLYAIGGSPTAPRGLFTSAGPLVRLLQNRLGPDRYLLSPLALEKHEGSDVWDWKHRLYGLTNAPFRLSAAANFGEPLVPRRNYEWMDALYRAPSAQAAAAFFPWAGIRYLMTPKPLAGSPGLSHEGSVLWRIYRKKGRISRAYALSLEDGQKLPEALSIAWLDGEPGSPLAWQSPREDRLQIFGDEDKPRWIYVSLPRYPGWRSWLEAPPRAAEVDSLPALGAFQKLLAPPGPWTLHFLYRPASFRWGLALTLASLLALARYWYNRARLFMALQK
ncbi:MAG: hypothetical protein HY921_05650 [Elusimicrobia bacterium]|nr:hypothetical protein [Elusimicrobiota bacterium]